jgi:predicted transcriptional regulator
MSTDTTTINENILKFDNILTALNYLLEEIETRKESLISDDKVDNIVFQRMETRQFRDGLIQRINDTYGDSMYREVAFIVMETIDNDIDAFLNARLDERLKSLGLIPQ